MASRQCENHAKRLGEFIMEWRDVRVTERSRLRLRLFPRAETAVRGGHPWIFGDSIKEQNREGEAGELAVIYDRQDRFMAIGFYDPDSPIRVRIIHQGKPATIDQEWWALSLRRALAQRSGILADGRTNGLRLVNGDSEGFPGMVIDRYADTLVVKIYTTAWLPRWPEMEAIIREVHQPRHLVLRMSRNILNAARDAWGLEEGYRGDAGDDVVVFTENGIRFEAAVRHGQKTGFFLDQRDNRSRVESLAKGREVLNVFSFSGGFSLYAARGGAVSVTDLDISAHALESASRNFELNFSHGHHATVEHRMVQADAFEWLDHCKDSFDMIIVDPPSLAKREREREGAIKAYERLNRMAIELLAPGGVLLAASCSAHVSREDFQALLGRVIRDSRREHEELWRSEHALDHPATFVEARYLKACCLRFTS